MTFFRESFNCVRSSARTRSARPRSPQRSSFSLGQVAPDRHEELIFLAPLTADTLKSIKKVAMEVRDVENYLENGQFLTTAMKDLNFYSYLLQLKPSK